MTLVELVIALAIIVMLATVAYPHYQNHVLKAHRTAAITDIAKAQVELERLYRTSYQSAANSVLSSGTCSFCTLDSNQFTISISASKSAYTIKAEPLGSQLTDQCSGISYTQLTVNELGEVSPQSCWL